STGGIDGNQTSAAHQTPTLVKGGRPRAEGALSKQVASQEDCESHETHSGSTPAKRHAASACRSATGPRNDGCSRPSSISSSTSRLPERLVSNCRLRCSPAPTR